MLRKMKIYLYWLIISISFVNFNKSLASEPIILEYADELIGEQDSVSNIRRLVGNVRLRQGNIILTCDHAIQYLNQNKYDLSGDVVIKQNTITLKSPSVHYDGNTFIATATNGVEITDKDTRLTAMRGRYSTQSLVAYFEQNVFVEDDSVRIYSDFVRHNRNDGISDAWGRVLLEGKYTNSRLIGDSIRNVPAGNYSIAYGNPHLLQIDSVAKSNDGFVQYRYDTLTIVSDVMEAFRDFGNERYIANGNVEIVRDNVQSKSCKAIYYKDEEFIFLEEKPIVWSDSTQLYSDTIYVYLPNNNLERLRAVSKAFSVSISDSLRTVRKDQLAGNEIELIFKQDTLKFIHSRGDAKSLYFINTDDEPDGIISVSADNITIEMLDGKAETIIMTNQVPGEYHPEPIIVGREKEFYLPYFKWSDLRPKQAEIYEFLIRKNLR